MAIFTIHGARGTMPACGKDFLKYGGNTTCFSVKTDQGLIVIDAGTGVWHVASALKGLEKMPSITMLFTHFHLDHLIGLPRFDPLYHWQAKITLMSDPRRGSGWSEHLRAIMGKPYWPVGFGEAAAITLFASIPVDQPYMELYGVRLSWFLVPHPQQCLAYRIEMPGNTVLVATDVEYEAENVDPEFIGFCHNADFLIFDSQYTPEEYPSHRGWGHSTWETAVRVARAANVRRLVLTHHDPARSDDEVDRIVGTVRKAFPETTAASENMILTP